MIVYLDQNKWIELARMFHEKDQSDRARSIQRNIKASLASGYKYPLSATHYFEFSRIGNDARRSRLGQVMWEYSGGRTLISTREILEYEIEVGLRDFIPEIRPRNIRLIGEGIAHAFGIEAKKIMPNWINSTMEKSMLTGSSELNIEPLSFFSDKQRRNFKSHLESLQEDKKKLEKTKWDDWLHAISLTDVLEPLNTVLLKNNLDPKTLTSFIAHNWRDMVTKMPTRLIDIHLHHQVLKNSQYSPKISDLEDWAGLGVAASYCDIVVCEKHFANMVARDGFKSNARIETNLSDIFR